MSTIAIIQCRLGSSRFPRKALANLNGKPVIRHVVERACQIQGLERIIVATPPEDQMEIAVAVDGLDDRVSVFAARIDNDDVLGRFVAALENYPDCDTVMRLTGDCPMIDQAVCEAVLRLYQSSGGTGYAWTDTHSGVWPDGLDCEVFARQLLQSAHETVTDPVEREHVTPAIRASVTVMSLPAGDAFKDWPKVSIDTFADLARVRELLK